MLLIGGYTHYPVGIPAKAGEGVALFREENNTVEKIIPAENPSFLASDGSGGFFALKESDSGLLQHFVPNSSEGLIFVCGENSVSRSRKLSSLC